VTFGTWLVFLRLRTTTKRMKRLFSATWLHGFWDMYVFVTIIFLRP
jgi:hypothetical protein